MAKKKPYYPLAEVKAKILAREYEITPRAQFRAYNDFKWGPEKIRKCLLKLNDKDHAADKERNHFYKTANHDHVPHTKLDYYKARYIMEEDVFIHLYIRNEDKKLIIDSFHKLEYHD